MRNFVVIPLLAILFETAALAQVPGELAHNQLPSEAQPSFIELEEALNTIPADAS